MTRRIALITIVAALAAVTLAAQAGPAGWKMRIDRSTNASDPDGTGPIKFTAEGGAFHAVNPQAAVYWNPANSASGAYTIKGTFKLNQPSGHTNYYGLVFGGSALDGADQSYIYFMVAQDGTWLVKKRDGAQTPTVSPKTPDDAVKKPGADGTSVNSLEVRVLSDKVDYVVNGKVVYSTPKTGLTAKTDGIYGIRVNHLLDVAISDFGMKK